MGIGSGNTPGRRQRCTKCGEPGHKANNCEKRKRRAEMLADVVDRREEVLAGVRFLIVSTLTYRGDRWEGDSEWIAMRATGKLVGEWAEWELRGAGGEVRIGYPELYPFQRRPPGADSFKLGPDLVVPKIGCGFGIRTIPERLEDAPPELPAPDVPDPPELVAAAREIPETFKRRVRMMVAASGDDWETALRAVLKQDRNPAVVSTRCMVLERTGRKCISCRPAAAIAKAS